MFSGGLTQPQSCASKHEHDTSLNNQLLYAPENFFNCAIWCVFGVYFDKILLQKIPKYIIFYVKILLNCSHLIARGVLGHTLDIARNFGQQFESITAWSPVAPSPLETQVHLHDLYNNFN